MNNYNENDPYWNTNENSYYQPEVEYSNMQSENFDFQSFDNSKAYPYQENPSFANPQFLQPQQYGDMFTPMMDVDDNEPPLLEELEIYPDRILEKTLTVLNPFRSHSLADDAEFLIKETDLAGPMCFCLIMACCLLLAGKAPFGYIYGLSVISCLFMYALLNLMSARAEIFTLSSVASILGYCILPIVALACLSIFVSLHGSVGLLLAMFVVFWSSLSSSRLFVALSSDSEQRPLLAYPCALVYGVFALLVVF